jgi:uncharacterized protein (TIGR02569 family)
VTESDTSLPRGVASAFGIGGTVHALPGGQGRSVVADGLVLKPDSDPAATEWLADVCARVQADGFRLPAPVSAVDGRRVVDGWCAVEFVEGAAVDDDDQSAQIWCAVLAAGRSLHRALRHEPPPGFVAARTDRWAAADRLAWGSPGRREDTTATPLLAGLRRLVVDEGLGDQLIHGDLSGNVLLSPCRAPAVIDFSPYWRPAAYADAIIVIDALLWWRADPVLLDLGRPEGLNPGFWTSLLARAAIFRLLSSTNLDEECGTFEDVLQVLNAQET